MYPDSCHTCLCTKEFNSSVPIDSNKDCKKVDCGIELRSLYRLQSGCVPIYYGKSDCCPIDFRCRKNAVFHIFLHRLHVQIYFQRQQKMKLCHSKDELT